MTVPTPFERTPSLRICIVVLLVFADIEVPVKAAGGQSRATSQQPRPSGHTMRDRRRILAGGCHRGLNKGGDTGAEIQPAAHQDFFALGKGMPCRQQAARISLFTFPQRRRPLDPRLSAQKFSVLIDPAAEQRPMTDQGLVGHFGRFRTARRLPRCHHQACIGQMPDHCQSSFVADREERRAGAYPPFPRQALPSGSACDAPHPSGRRRVFRIRRRRELRSRPRRRPSVRRRRDAG